MLYSFSSRVLTALHTFKKAALISEGSITTMQIFLFSLVGINNQSVDIFVIELRDSFNDNNM